MICNFSETVITKRLTLRRIKADDWESIQRIWEDQKSSPYAHFDKPSDTDPDAVRKRIAKWASFGKSTDHMFFAVCLTDAVIGYVAFNRCDGGYETGYCFHSDYHGKGYAKESISALIIVLLSTRPDASVKARTALENLPSVGLLQSLGFIRTGTERVSFYQDANGHPIWFDGGIFEYGIQS